ncbi:AEC family transporter [Hydrocarboniclastica marina]|uniref:AEC family transporter n=2 Tax=Hydrocarboniclastica marina TaxID=2259620 RepID=A0A4P7XMI3_9ALTE|nr:AEC family transporter [Hydrocarboniclastica marina]
MGMGWVLRRAGLIDDAFVETASQLVFRVALPTLIFLNLSQLDLASVLDLNQLLFALGVTVLGFGLLWATTGWLGLAPENRDVFVQGAFRGNLGIVGIALCASLYGNEGLAVGSVLLAVLTFAYNVLSVYALAAADGGATPWREIFLNILRNPLIISIVSGTAVTLLGVPLPDLVVDSGDYFSALTLPLALLCVGASINRQAWRAVNKLSSWSVCLKLVVLPALYTGGAVAMGFNDLLLGTLFVMFAAPTATVSYVMARAMRGNSELAASLVALSTLLSPISLSLGIWMLSSWGFIAPVP